MSPKKKAYHETPLPEAEVAIEVPDAVALPVVPKKVHCPQHLLYELTVEEDDEKFFAICNCPVRSNMWKGRVVWEKAKPRHNSE